LKIFLDNTWPPVFARSLNLLCLQEGHSIIALRDRFSPDTIDVVWIPELASEGGWVIVSGDNHILKKPHELKVWKESGMTGFFMLGGWTERDFWEQAWMLTRWWPTIMQAAKRRPVGTAFDVPFSGSPTRLRESII
jgi:hypothetical protein